MPARCSVGSIVELARPLAFVFSGGGAAGAAQIGQLRAAIEVGLEPDLIVGTSVGALNGAVVSALGCIQAVEALAEVWRQASRRRVFGPATRIPRNIARHRSIADPEAFAQFVRANISVTRIEDLNHRFAAVAARLDNGEATILQSGPLESALRASAAVPGLLPPVQRDGIWLIDGGTTANLPVAQAVELGAASAVTFDVLPLGAANHPPTRGPASALLHSTRLSLRSQASHHPRLLSDLVVVDLPAAVPPEAGIFDFADTEDLMSNAYREASRFLASWNPPPA